MANNIPLYTASREYARVHNEIPLWRESINENIRCKQAIEEAVRQSFDVLSPSFSSVAWNTMTMFFCSS